ncbi:hypothetical protein V6N11_061317 [Hibiscus sabdariffa]|uniref:Uncharacterized protein n=1 Tax=Hibiscus sabdariffa TaxID=183260 RepID=A0ABR2NVW0_9ROSI
MGHGRAINCCLRPANVSRQLTTSSVLHILKFNRRSFSTVLGNPSFPFFQSLSPSPEYNALDFQGLVLI